MNKGVLKAYAAKMARGATVRDAEAEIVRIVTEQARAVAGKYRFGYHDRADMIQQGVLFVLEAIEEGKYDVSRPLENFSYVHMRNRLLNYKRKHFMRSEKPCDCCDPFDPPINPCERWVGWNERNVAKQNLMMPIDVFSVEDEKEKNMRVEYDVEGMIEMNDAMDKIDRELPVSLRGDYLKMKAGVNISKSRRDAVRDAITGMFHEEG